jgi:hypothetical protein
MFWLMALPTVLLFAARSSEPLALWGRAAQPAPDAPLPGGVKAVWDLDNAHRDKSPMRERVCLNGLWRWQPAAPNQDNVPQDGWGYFKVPAFWPGTTNYIQEDCQSLHAHPRWKATDLRGVAAAWYQREITIPADWNGRRIAIAAEYVNSLAAVYVDRAKAGDVRFPAGEVDVTAQCRPGTKHRISFLVHALPLKAVLLAHTDTNSAREVKGKVDRRGLCEYGVPFTWDWTMYRGWYRGERSFGSANVPWEFCQAEWSAQFLGDWAGVPPRILVHLKWE